MIEDLSSKEKTGHFFTPRMIFYSKHIIVFLMMAFISEVALSQELNSSEPDSITIEVPDAIWTFVFERTFDHVVLSAGLKPLRKKELEKDEKEIRIWFGGGIFAPKFLYRITESDGTVKGELLLYWRVREIDIYDDGKTTHDWMLYYRSSNCEDFNLKSGFGTCRALFETEPDWKSILRKMEDQGIWKLPDSSELPDAGTSLDGWGITIELREDYYYRTYNYSNPNHKPWPEAAQAVQIAGIVSKVRYLMKRSELIKNYRGVTTGINGSAFNECESGEVMGFKIGISLEALAQRWEVELPEAGKYGYIVEVTGERSPEWVANRRSSKFNRDLDVGRLISINPAFKPACK